MPNSRLSACAFALALALSPALATDQSTNGATRVVATGGSVTEIVYELGLLPEPAYVFKHAVTREVAYGGLTKARRARLHARFADWIERLIGEVGQVGVFARESDRQEVVDLFRRAQQVYLNTH